MYPSGKSLEEIAHWLKKESESSDFITSMTDLLLELCDLRTIPGEDIVEAAKEENAVMDRLIKALNDSALPGRIEKIPINESIANSPRYTKPYYTTAEKPYMNRSNLVHVFEPEDKIKSGHSLAFDAHMDTVAPYFKPYLKDGMLYGRGACDDKGCCVALVGASVLLEKLRKSHGISPRGRIVSMFAIDEESGGNGSLSLAADKNLATLYDTMIIAESTQGQIHAANRGAVWYKVEFGTETPEATAFALKVVRAFEETGRALRRESEHPQFPSKPVQTCHGVIGGYGEHPSGICGYVEFLIASDQLEITEIAECVERGLADYIASYGDRTKILDPLTKTPKIAKHYDLIWQGKEILLKVYGNTGHMGSSLENDNAITKAAFLVPEILRSHSMPIVRLARAGTTPFILEGGQGFLPSHTIDQVKARMGKALSALYAEEVAKNAYHGQEPILSFDKLHNEAFARDPDSVEVLKAIEAARLVGIDIALPLIGFPASCDARLFAGLYHDKQVLTVGPGSIRFAHADNEHIDMTELAQSCAFYALYALYFTGAIGPGMNQKKSL